MRSVSRLLLWLLCALGVNTAIAQIKVDCQGHGEAVFLVGGGPAFTTWNLEPLQRQLRDEYRVCRWDMRGVGDNADLEISDNGPVLEQWLRDMLAVLPEQPVVLWGHSWGALQVLLFAKYHPQRVKALVLNNPVDPLLASLDNIESKRYVHPGVEARLFIDDIDTPVEQRHRLRSKIASYFIDAELGWSYASGFSTKDANNALNVRIWEEYRNKPLSMRDLRSLEPLISALIFCKQDVLMPENLQTYAAVIPADRLNIIEECAHFPWVEAPETFYKALSRSINEAVN
jgi:pimeloyl-ACP methyl ester carboxylesterase